jgi:hypothetical protein
MHNHTEKKQLVSQTNSISGNNNGNGVAMPAVSVLQQKESEDIINKNLVQQKDIHQFVRNSNDETNQLKLFQLKPNKTGMPDNLKSGIENLSGMSMDHVRVHYNSSQPAQLNALAYAQGSDIHVAAGQEKHLPHEAWHVVQQAQGRVQPTMQMKTGVAVNDNPVLEHEADVMGEKAVQFSDYRPATSAQLKLQEMANNNPNAQEAFQFQVMENNLSSRQLKPLQEKINSKVVQRSFKSNPNSRALENVRKNAGNIIFNNLFDELHEDRKEVDLRVTAGSRTFLFNEMAICLKAIDYERMTSGDFQSDEGKEAIAGACHEMKHALDIISGTVGNPAFAQGMAKLDTIITTELNAWLSEAKSYFYSRGVDPVVRGWLEFNPNRWDDRNQIWSRLKNYTFMVFEQLDIPSDDLENRWSHFRDRLYGPSGSLTPKILIRKENFEMFCEHFGQQFQSK